MEKQCLIKKSIKAMSRSRSRHLRDYGVQEIQMVVSCPPTRHPCPHGIDFSLRGELIAAEKEDGAEIASFIGLDSLHCLSIEGLVQATGIPRENFCLACYSGDYPLPSSKNFGKFCFERQIK